MECFIADGHYLEGLAGCAFLTWRGGVELQVSFPTFQFLSRRIVQQHLKRCKIEVNTMHVSPGVFMRPISWPPHFKRTGTCNYCSFINLQVKARRAALTCLATTKKRAFAAWMAGITAARVSRAKSQKVGSVTDGPIPRDAGICVWLQALVPICRERNPHKRNQGVKSQLWQHLGATLQAADVSPAGRWTIAYQACYKYD